MVSDSWRAESDVVDLAADEWRETAESQEEYEEQLLGSVDLTGSAAQSKPTEAVGEKSVRHAGESLEGADGMDGEHWSLVDIRSSRFQRLLKRNRLSAQEQLNIMGCEPAADFFLPQAPPSPPSDSLLSDASDSSLDHERIPDRSKEAVQATDSPTGDQNPSGALDEIDALIHELEAESDDDDLLFLGEAPHGIGREVVVETGRSDDEPGEDMGEREREKERKRKRKKKRKRRAMEDEVTLEENLQFDGSYWQIDVSDARTRRRKKRKHVEVEKEVVSKASGSYGERKRQAQAQMEEFRQQQALKLAKQQLWNYGEYHASLEDKMAGKVPDFLRIYRRQWKKSPERFAARVKKGGCHFSFVKEHDKRRRLGGDDRTGLLCLIKALTAAKGHAKSSDNGSLHEDLDEGWNYYESQQEIYASMPPPRKRQRTSSPTRRRGLGAGVGPSLTRESVAGLAPKRATFLESARAPAALGAPARSTDSARIKALAVGRRAGVVSQARLGGSLQGSRSVQQDDTPVRRGRKQGAPQKKKVSYRGGMLSGVYDIRPVIAARPSTMTAADYERSLQSGAPGGVPVTSRVPPVSDKSRQSSTGRASSFGRQPPRTAFVASRKKTRKWDYVAAKPAEPEPAPQRAKESRVPTHAAALAPSLPPPAPVTKPAATAPQVLPPSSNPAAESHPGLPPEKTPISHAYAFPRTLSLLSSSRFLSETELELPDSSSEEPVVSVEDIPALEHRFACHLEELLGVQSAGEELMASGASPTVLAASLRALDNHFQKFAGTISVFAKQLIAADQFLPLRLLGSMAHTLICNKLAPFLSPLPDIVENLLASSCQAGMPELSVLHESITWHMAVSSRVLLLSVLSSVSGPDDSGLLGGLARSLLTEYAQIYLRRPWLLSTMFVSNVTDAGAEASPSLLFVLLRRLLEGMAPHGSIWPHVKALGELWATPSIVNQGARGGLQASLCASGAMDESQLMEEIRGIEGDSFGTRGEHEDVTELLWAIVVHAAPLDTQPAPGRWEVVADLFRRMDACLKVADVPSELRGDVSSLLDGDVPRSWLMTKADRQWLAEGLRRVLGISALWSTAESHGDMQAVGELIVTVAAHFRVLHFTDGSNRFAPFLSGEEVAASGAASFLRDDLPFTFFLKIVYNHLWHVSRSSLIGTARARQQQLLRLASRLFTEIVPDEPYIISTWNAHSSVTAAVSRAKVRNCISVLLTFGAFADSRSLAHLLDRIVDMVNFTKSQSSAKEIVMEGLYLALGIKYRLQEALHPEEGPLLDPSDLNLQAQAIVSVIEKKRKELLASHRQLLLSPSPDQAELRALNRILDMDAGLVRIIADDRQKTAVAQTLLLGEGLAGTVQEIVDSYPLPAALLLPTSLVKQILAPHMSSVPLSVRCRVLQMLMALLRADPLPAAEVATAPSSSQEQQSGLTEDGDIDFGALLLPSEEEMMAALRRQRAGSARRRLLRTMVEHGRQIAVAASSVLSDVLGVLEAALARAGSPLGPRTNAIEEQQRRQAIFLACHCVGKIAALCVFHGIQSNGFGSWAYYLGRFGATRRWLGSESTALGRQVPLRILTAALSHLQSMAGLPRQSPLPSLAEDEILRLWLAGMVEPTYTVQHRFTRALLFLYRIQDCPLLTACFGTSEVGSLSAKWRTERSKLIKLTDKDATFAAGRSFVLGFFLGRLSLLLDGTVTMPGQRQDVQRLLSHVLDGLAVRMLDCLKQQLASLRSAGQDFYIKFCLRLLATICEDLPQLVYRPGNAKNQLPTMSNEFFLSLTIDRSLQAKYLPMLVRGISRLQYAADAYLQRLLTRIYERWISAKGGDKVLASCFTCPSPAAADQLASLRHHWIRQIVLPKGGVQVVDKLATLAYLTLLLHNSKGDQQLAADALVVLPFSLCVLSAAKTSNATAAPAIVLRIFELWLNIIVDGCDLCGDGRMGRLPPFCEEMRAAVRVLCRVLVAEAAAAMGARMPPDGPQTEYDAHCKYFIPVHAKLTSDRQVAALAATHHPWADVPLPSSWRTVLPPHTAARIFSKALDCLLAVFFSGDSGRHAVMEVLPSLHAAQADPRNASARQSYCVCPPLTLSFLQILT